MQLCVLCSHASKAHRKDTLYVCVEGLLEGMRKRGRMHDEVLFFLTYDGVMMGKQYREICKKKFSDKIAGQNKDNNFIEKTQKSRTTTLRTPSID